MITKREDILKKAPTTRYQGSKRSILPWIYDNLKDLKFKTVLDGFGGSGIVSYLFKLMDKKVTFNDILASNHMAGIALIENESVQFTSEDLEFLLHKNGFKYPTFIQDNFRGIYYLSKENQWLDIVSYNIKMLSERYKGDILRKKQALAYYALFQACPCKRPFNLFHRRNLYLRTARVDRSFGNRTTWNTTFHKLFSRFAAQANNKIFKTRRKHVALCEDIMRIKKRSFDLVYLDPPYARKTEKHPKNYHSMYHFLEGLLSYDTWGSRISWKTKNRALIHKKTRWDTDLLEDNFDTLFRRFRKSIIVVSYGAPGYPSIYTIRKILKQYKSNARVIRRPYNYKLSNKNGGLFEVLLIGQ